MKLAQEIQNKLLALAVYSPAFLAEYRQRLKPDHFQGKEAWIVCTLAYQHYDKYNAPIDWMIDHEWRKYAKRVGMTDDAQELLRTLVDSLDPLQEAEETYVMSEAEDFVRDAETRLVLEDFLPKYASGNYNLDDLAGPLSRIARERVQHEDEGDVLSDTRRRAIQRLTWDYDDALIPTLIPPLDEKIGGLRIGDIGTIMSPSGIGKSRCMVHLGKAALALGFGVVHYTLEMSRDKIIRWYDQMFVGASEQELNSPATVQRLARRANVLAASGGNLQVVYLSCGYDTSYKGSKTAMLRADLQRRKARMPVPPRLVLIDYGDLLADGGARSRYEAQGLVWRELKNTCVEEEVAIWAATQSARGGVGAQRVTELEIGDSYEKMRVSDIFLGFNRNIIFDQKNRKWIEEDPDQIYNERTVRLFGIKHRDRQDKWTINFTCDFDHGVFYSPRLTESGGGLGTGASAERKGRPAAADKVPR